MLMDTNGNTKELIKDLCSRLPYSLYVQDEYGDILHISYNDVHFANYFNAILEGNIKPYLFPLSSITEEQSMELFKLFGINLVDSIGANYIKINECTGITFFLYKGFDVETHLDKLIDWLNVHHFDYRGLIEKGLAIDATGLNIY